MAIKPKKVALIGAGMVADTHVTACCEAGDIITLAGILSKSGTSAKKLADIAQQRTGKPVQTYQHIDEIVSLSDCDFVIITTPPNVRKDIIAPLAKAGKHILLEKPIARTAEEARQIVTICQDHNIMLGVVFQHRARQASQHAKKIIAETDLGALGVVEMSVPWWREQSYYDEPGRGSYDRDGGGVLISQAIHTIDLALSLAGPVKSVIAMAKTSCFHEMEAEDFVTAGLTFHNGAVGSLTASTASFPGTAEAITLHFEKASLHLEAGILTLSWRDGRIERFGAQAGTGGGADPMAFTHEWHQAVIENFARAIETQEPLLASGADALAAHNLIEAITKSANTKTEQDVLS